MKKTVSINLQGIIFNIDEDAYQLLSSYLEKLEKHFGNNEESSEIIKDIEARIAELFNEKLSQHRQVINIDDVKHTISILGEANDIIDGDIEYENDNGNDDDNKEAQKEKARKKLFRDTENRIAGGVCSGLAAYSGINLFAIRSIFVILFLISAGTFFLLYILLWIVVPKPRTRAEKLEMRGKKVTIENIEKNIREEYEDIKSNMKDIGKSGFPENFERLGKSFAGFINIFFKAFKKVFGLGLVVFGILFLISFVLGIFAFNSQTLVYDWAGITIVPITGILKLLAEPQTIYIFLIAIAMAIGIPFIVMIYSGICILLNIKSNKILNLSLFISWIVGILLCVGMGFIISTEFMSHRSITDSHPIICNSASCDTIYISANDNKTTDLDIEDLIFEEISLYRENEAIQALGEIEIEIKQTKDTVFLIEVIKSSRGNNNSLASENAKRLIYDFSIENNYIVFNKYFHLPKDFKIRGQEVEITIYIPNNKYIYIDESIDSLIDDTDNINNIDEDNMAGYLWKMTNNGLVLPQNIR
ncbi:MAG: PspC domain-containing protein [Bacteroidales bacterium]|nr:PspC domain-containing protein [Bacteroidales bacterium]